MERHLLTHLTEQAGFGAEREDIVADEGDGAKICIGHLNALINRVRSMTQGHELDITSDEDLGLGIMNLISIEEHLFMTANKTGKDHYYNLLLEVREIRKALLKNIVTSFEGEVWCISKHLLASSMRLMEVGTKELKINGVADAKPYFEKSYRLFRMFWETVLQQPGIGVDEPKASVSGTQNVTFFYEPTCPHCKIVDAFIAENGLGALFNIIKVDVTSNQASRTDMERVQADCMPNATERRVPFVVQNRTCAMGEHDAIQFFKNLVWDTIAVSKTSMQSRLAKDIIPESVEAHMTDTNKSVDATLDCCKE